MALADELAKQNASLKGSIVAVATKLPPPSWFPELPQTSPEVALELGRFKRLAYKEIGERVGTLTIPEPPPYHVSVVFNKAVLATKFLGEDSERIDFTVSLDDVMSVLGSARAEVIDGETGETLTARPMASRSFAIRDSRHHLMEGEATWSGLWAGDQVLRLTASGRAMWSRKVTIEPGVELDLGVVRMSRGVHLKAHVVDPQGQPASTAFVLGRVDPETRETAFDTSLAYGSNRDGILHVRMLEPALYVLRSHGERQLATSGILVDLSRGPIENLEVRLEAATQVSLNLATKLSWYRIHDVSGYAIRSGDPRSRGAVLRLVPGEYVLVLGDKSGERERRPFSVELRAMELK